ncbi:MAG: hypothetical protein PVH42_20485, partial [Desulfobacterales bacterium]
MAPSDKEILLTSEDLNLLYEVSKSIHSIQDLTKLLQNILLKIKEVFAIEGASIALHDAVNKEFYFIRTVEEQCGIAKKEINQMR